MRSRTNLHPRPVLIKKLDNQALQAQTMKVGEYYQCEKILDFQICKDRRNYLIKWRGYGDDYNTWQPISTISVIAYELAQFQSLNKDYIQSKEAEWTQKELQARRRKIKGVPHFTKELQLLEAFADEYLNLENDQLEERMALFLQQIESKDTTKSLKDHRQRQANITKVQSKPKSKKKFLNKTISELSGQKKELVSPKKSNSKSKSPKKQPLWPKVLQSSTQLRQNRIVRNLRDFQERKDELLSDKESREIEELCMSKLMSEESFNTIAEVNKPFKEPKLSNERDSKISNERDYKGKAQEKPLQQAEAKKNIATNELKRQQTSPPIGFSVYRRTKKIKPTSQQTIKKNESATAKKEAQNVERELTDEEKKEAKKVTYEYTANDGTKEKLITLITGLVSSKDLKQKQYKFIKVIRFYKIGVEILFELSVQVEGIMQNIYISYGLMRTHFMNELLDYLQMTQRVKL